MARVGAGFPFELIAGNHESDGNNGNINDFSACLPNQLPGVVGTYGRQWYVDVPQVDPLVRYVMISPALDFPDSTWTYTAGSPRYNWTAAAIDGAGAAGIPWVVVGMHKPCLSISIYTCEPGADLINMLLAKDVDLVLSGHDHTYQRTKQLGLGAGCASLTIGSYNAACVADADSTMVKGAGTVFATVGTGGTPLRDVNLSDPEAPYMAAYSGLNANPTWGSLDVTIDQDELSASFLRGSGGTFNDPFTIQAAPSGNQPPVAAFTSGCVNLTCSFDAGTSTDNDGTITSYAWDFGDGATGSGVVPPAHPYATAGTYTVTLTVTDDDTATDTPTGAVSPTAPTTTYATDTFTRTVTNGLGTADTGGAWSVGSGAANFSVSGGLGRIRIPTAGAGSGATLPGVSQSATDLTMSVATDKPVVGGALFVSVRGRNVPSVGDYRAKVRFKPDGGIGLSLSRMTASGTETTIQAEVTIAGLTYAVGDRLNVRVQVTGTSPTTIRARVWKVGTTEPTTWQRTITDSTAGFQTAGNIGITVFFVATSTSAPLVVTMDDLVARAP